SPFFTHLQGHLAAGFLQRFVFGAEALDFSFHLFFGWHGVPRSSDTTPDAHVTLKNSYTMPRFDSILFDFDGVLIDSEPLHYATWSEVLAPCGIILEWEDYRARYLGIDDRDMIRRLGAEAPPPP